MFSEVPWSVFLVCENMWDKNWDPGTPQEEGEHSGWLKTNKSPTNHYESIRKQQNHTGIGNSSPKTTESFFQSIYMNLPSHQPVACTWHSEVEKDNLVNQSDLFGIVMWPFNWLSDLQIGARKVALNDLQDSNTTNMCFTIFILSLRSQNLNLLQWFIFSASSSIDIKQQKRGSSNKKKVLQKKKMFYNKKQIKCHKKTTQQHSFFVVCSMIRKHPTPSDQADHSITGRSLEHDLPVVVSTGSASITSPRPVQTSKTPDLEHHSDITWQVHEGESPTRVATTIPRLSRKSKQEVKGVSFVKDSLTSTFWIWFHKTKNAVVPVFCPDQKCNPNDIVVQTCKTSEQKKLACFMLVYWWEQAVLLP